jgi:hypothetical protein
VWSWWEQPGRWPAGAVARGFLVGWLAIGHSAAAVAEPAPPPLETVPTLELESGYFARGGPGPRQVLTNLLRLASQSAFDQLTYELALGAMALFESGGEERRSNTTVGLANLALGGRYHVGSADRLSANAGLLFMLGLTSIQPSPLRRAARSAYSHAIAMRGAWESWLWAPDGGGGLVFPFGLTHAHQVRGWRGRAELKGALALSLLTDPRRTAFGRVVQLGLGYDLQPRRWLALGSELRLVWMPTAELYQAQGSVVPYLWLGIGRWRVAGEVIVNVDAPYGWLGGGQRMWATQLKLGINL